MREGESLRLITEEELDEQKEKESKFSRPEEVVASFLTDKENFECFGHIKKEGKEPGMVVNINSDGKNYQIMVEVTNMDDDELGERLKRQWKENTNMDQRPIVVIRSNVDFLLKCQERAEKSGVPINTNIIPEERNAFKMDFLAEMIAQIDAQIKMLAKAGGSSENIKSIRKALESEEFTQEEELKKKITEK